ELAQADLDPEYRYATVLAAIDASVADLSPDDQARYAQLAVFASHSPFPIQAAVALWSAALTEAEAESLLVKLTAWSLIRVAGEEMLAAHDLQYGAMSRRLGQVGLASANAQLIDRYRRRHPEGWSGLAADPYMGSALVAHLHAAGQADEMRSAL